jgi:hypothetical protein
MEFIIAIFEIVRRLARDMGPYLLVEIVLPGGSLLALALFLYRRGTPLSISLIAKRLLVRAPEPQPVLSRR